MCKGRPRVGPLPTDRLDLASLSQSRDAQAGRRPVAASVALCSSSRSHPEAEIAGGARDHIPLRTTETAAVTHFADVPLKLRVHFLGLDEVLPGRVQVLLQLRYVGRQGCQALLHLALLPRLLVNDFLQLDHLGQVFLVAQRAVGGSLRGKGSLRRPCSGREGTQHFRETGAASTAFCALGAHRTLTAALTYMVR